MFVKEFVRESHQDGLGHPPAFHYLDLDTEIYRIKCWNQTSKDGLRSVRGSLRKKEEKYKKRLERVKEIVRERERKKDCEVKRDREIEKVSVCVCEVKRDRESE